MTLQSTPHYICIWARIILTIELARHANTVDHDLYAAECWYKTRLYNRRTDTWHISYTCLTDQYCVEYRFNSIMLCTMHTVHLSSTIFFSYTATPFVSQRCQPSIGQTNCSYVDYPRRSKFIWYNSKNVTNYACKDNRAYIAVLHEFLHEYFFI